MKAILEYNFPEDEEQFNVASKATELYLCLWDLDQRLREQIKYGENTSEEVKDAYGLLREWIREEMYERGCSLNMMS